MMYAGSKLGLVNKVIDCVASALLDYQAFTSQVQLQHVFEIRELEEMTEEWLVNKLARN